MRALQSCLIENKKKARTPTLYVVFVVNVHSPLKRTKRKAIVCYIERKERETGGGWGEKKRDRERGTEEKGSREEEGG